MKFPRASSLAILAVLSGGVMLTAPPALAQLSIGISVTLAPPVLPVYVQPPLPAPDYIWAPGYWAWDADAADYYWVPGTWVLAPQPGYLWTPGYWGWGDGAYLFHPGYWGPHIGFYGGVNYGYGYTGSGFQGGYWQGPHFFYNRSVNNISNVHITNVYNRTVIINRTTVNNISYNGGPGGIAARPSATDLIAEHDHHIDVTPLQRQHIDAARTNRALFFKANHGVPAIAATARPADFGGPGVVHASNAPVAAREPERAIPAANAPGTRPGTGIEKPRPVQHEDYSQPHPTDETRPMAQPEFHPQGMQPAPVHHEEYSEPHPAGQPRPMAQPAYHPEPAPVHHEEYSQPHPAGEPRPVSQPAYHPDGMKPAPVHHEVYIEHRPAAEARPRPRPATYHAPRAPHPEARPPMHEEKHNP